MNWLENILFGLVSGLSDILPVSAQAHKLLLLKLFGISKEPSLLRLLIHVSIFAAVYYNCMPHIVKIFRAKSLSRIPKRRRKRPLDVKSLMDFRLWQTMVLPVILVYLFYEKISGLHTSLILMAVFLFINGAILYIPPFLPGSNKDSRTLSRVEGILMGLGGAASVLPGISGVGAAMSVASVTGVERVYSLSMVLLMHLAVTAALIVFDILALFGGGMEALSFTILLSYLASAAAAFLGATVAIRLMRSMAAEKGFLSFAFYCWGLALLTFLLNLLA